MRKTIKIVDLIAVANRVLRYSTNGCKGDRQGVALMIERVLIEADVYAGYGYLTQDQIPPGCEPGIVTDSEGNCEFPDLTRRIYYTHPRLR